MQPVLKHCWFLAGPTAAGKTATAIALSHRIDAEVLSMDSMAIYRGMDIGTAKPDADERQQVPHHLIDIADPSEEFSVAEYAACAQQAAADVLQRNRTPLFVGGTGLYLRALLRGVFDGPDADWTLRQELNDHALRFGNESLHRQLAEVDPVTAARLHPNDTRRVIRAIEVYRITGQPLSDQQQNKPLPEGERPRAVFWLEPPRDWLHERINRRVDLMMVNGLLEETRALLARTPALGRTARQALGYREIIDHLEGRLTLGEAIEQIKTGTRQFAKRQHTWFRNLEEVRSIPMSGTESPDELADRLAADR